MLTDVVGGVVGTVEDREEEIGKKREAPSQMQPYWQIRL
jgi:hypothetical protein